jgi:hypothetical protein
MFNINIFNVFSDSKEKKYLFVYVINGQYNE